MADEVRYTRMLESFEDFRDKEVVYGALSAAILLVERTDPNNGILDLLLVAQAHRVQELRDTYESQRYRRQD